MKKHIFIVNPISGRGKYREAVDYIEDYFKESKQEYEIHYTKYETHAEKLAAQYTEDAVLYSVGGDGTAHEILNGIHEGVELGIIPVGTGNDFWRMIHFDGDLKDIIYETINGKAQKIDIGQANGRRFLNCANIGLDVSVNRTVNENRYRFMPRQAIYMITALWELFRYKPTNIRVEIDGVENEYSVILASFMNGKQYGGGFNNSPQSNIQDGLLDISLIDDIPFWKVFFLLPKYYKGTHFSIKEVTTLTSAKVKVSSDDIIPFACDGEIFDFKEIEISSTPLSIPLRLPSKATIRQ